GVRASGGVHAPSGRGALSRPAPRRGVGHRLREPFERRGRLCSVPSREDRPTVRVPFDRNRSRSGVPAEQGMSRLPIRIRLTLPLALGMALVLASLGGFVYLRVGSTLLHTTDQNLLAQATEATLRLDKGRSPLDRDAASGVSIAQVIGRGGVVESSTPVGEP